MCDVVILVQTARQSTKRLQLVDNHDDDGDWSAEEEDESEDEKVLNVNTMRIAHFTATLLEEGSATVQVGVTGARRISKNGILVKCQPDESLIVITLCHVFSVANFFGTQQPPASKGKKRKKPVSSKAKKGPSEHRHSYPPVRGNDD